MGTKGEEQETQGQPSIGNLTIFNVFAQHAHKSPLSIALFNDNITITYGTLYHRVVHLSHHLACTYNIGYRTVVGVAMSKSKEWVVTVLALFRLGAVYTPMDRESPPARLQYMIQEANIEFVVLDQTCSAELLQFFNEFPAPARNSFFIVMRPDLCDQVLEGGHSKTGFDHPTINPDDPCYICFTSGSTGKPKGVILPHRGAINFMLAAASTLGYPLPVPSPTHVMDQNSLDINNLCGCTNGAITFDLSIADLFFPLTMGGKVYIVGSDALAQVDQFVEGLSRAKVSLVWITPSVLQLLTDSHSLPSTLTDIVSFGEPLPSALAKKLQAPNRRVWNWYGPTECSILSTSFLCENLTERVDVPIGKPLPNYEAYLLDEQLKEVPNGEIGHLFLGGPGVMLRYTNQAATEKALFSLPPLGGTFYKTGDLARFMQDGNLQYVGRVDRQIKLNGIRMELGEIENTLMSHHWIKHAIVRVGYSGSSKRTSTDYLENQQAFLVAYLLLNSEMKVSHEDLFHTMRSFLAKTLPSAMIPSRFMKLKELPINSHGKLDFNLLPPVFDNVEQNEQTQNNDTNHAEELLLDILSPLFQFPLTPNTNILELQEHQNALSSIAQNAHLAKALYDFGITVPQTAIYDHKTIKKLAAYIIKHDVKNTLATINVPLPMQSLSTHENVESCIRTCFENALNIHPVKQDDNFFMLGGTSFSAIKLTFLLWKQTGVEITFPLLVTLPTIRLISQYILDHINLSSNMAASLISSPAASSSTATSANPSDVRPASTLPTALPPTSPTIPIVTTPSVAQLSHYSSVKTRDDVHIVCLQAHPSAEKPKLFLIHPAFWSSVTYLELSTHFTGICTVYGIEGNPGPHSTTMQSLATTYLNAILDVQPKGPYYIAGYSFGAAVAYEIAHQMLGQGLELGRVALIAPPLWPLNVSSIRQFRLIIAVLRRFFDSNFHIPLRQQDTTNIAAWVDIVAQQMHKFLPYDAASHYLRQMYSDAHTSETLMVNYSPPTISVCNLVQMYLPAAEYSPFLVKIRNMWSKLCPNIQEISTSGDHNNTVYEQHAKFLVEQIAMNFFL